MIIDTLPHQYYAGTDEQHYDKLIKDDELLQETIDEALAQVGKPGDIKYIAGNQIDENWLLCNGAAVSRTDYATLFAAIGTKYGAGDGSTTFNIPNANGRWLKAASSDSDYGTLLGAGLPNITGNFAAMQYTARHANTAFYKEWESGNVGQGGGGFTNASIGFQAVLSSGVYGASNEVQPQSIVMYCCIHV